MPHDPIATDDFMTTTNPDDARLLADLQTLYAAPPVPDELSRNGAKQAREQFAQRGVGALRWGWRIAATRAKPLPRRTEFAAVAAVALFCVLAVALFQPGLSSLTGLPGALRPHPTPNRAQATQTSEAAMGEAPITLSSVAMVSATDGWAFGHLRSGACVVLHYDGTTWARSVGLACGYVYSISMLSADDGWALSAGPNYYGSTEEILHYANGSWQVQTTFPSPNAATPQADQAQQWYELHSIAMVSPTEGWAVGAIGYAGQNTPENALILHYANGHWTPAPINGLASDPSQTALLMGVSMVSPHEGWAVGSYADTSDYRYQMLILHYLNGAWSRVNWSEPGDLNGVDALPTGDIWAVGGVAGAGPSAVVHLRNGALVSQISPVPGLLYGVQVFSTPAGWNGWAVGDGAATIHDQDSVWTRQGYTIHNFTISSISLVSPTEGWAVGQNEGASAWETPNWDATLFRLHNGVWSIYPLKGF